MIKTHSEQRDPNSIGFTTIEKVAALMAPNLASLTQSQGVSWFNTTPIPFNRNDYPGTFVFVNPKVSQRSSLKARDFIANAVGKSAILPPITPDSTPTNVESFVEAKRYLDVKDFAKALPLSQKDADAGNTEAINELGYLYLWGWGVTLDFAKARNWYQKAADAGDARAMYRLGDLYEKGHGGARDYAKTIEWYQKSRPGR